MKLMLKLGLFLALMTLSFALLARQPAVEPIVGISMDELSKTPNQDKDKGYQFSKSSQQTTVTTKTTVEHHTTPWLPQAIILALLPIALIVVARYRIKKHALKDRNANTIDFEAAKNKKHHDENEKPSHYKKAS